MPDVIKKKGDTGSGTVALKKGSSGASVKALQQKLIALGLLPKGSDDGRFGKQTDAAVRAFQKANKLSVDGSVGANTTAAMTKAQAAATAKATAPATAPKVSPVVKPKDATTKGVSDGGTSKTATATKAAAGGKTVTTPAPTVTQPKPIVPSSTYQPQAPAYSGGGNATKAPVSPISQYQGTALNPVTSAPVTTAGYVPSTPLREPQGTTPLAEGIAARLQGKTPTIIPQTPIIPKQETTPINPIDQYQGTALNPVTQSPVGPLTPWLGTALNPITTAPVTPKGIQPQPTQQQPPSTVGVTPSIEEANVDDRYANRPELTPKQKYGASPTVGRSGGGTSGGGYTGGGGGTGGGGDGSGSITPPTTTPTTTAPTVPAIPPEIKPTVTQPIPVASPDYTPPENPYFKELSEMVFEYDPSTDEQYLQSAATLENQVVQMMIGRGGLYSSVTNSAIQAGLISLQIEFRAQAYDAFKEERAFKFDQAKFFETQIQNEFDRQMDMASLQLAQQKEAFSQQMQIADFDFRQQQEAFDQQMAVANYNLQAQRDAFNMQMEQASFKLRQQEAAHNRKMDTLNYNLRVQEGIQRQKQAEADANLKGIQLQIYGMADSYDKSVQTYNEMNERWKNDVYATDPEVRAYFSQMNGQPISSRLTYAAGNGYRTNVLGQLDQTRQGIANAAYEYDLGDLWKTRNSDFKTPADPEYTNVSETRSSKETDEYGNEINVSKTVSKKVAQ